MLCVVKDPLLGAVEGVEEGRQHLVGIGRDTMYPPKELVRLNRINIAWKRFWGHRFPDTFANFKFVVLFDDWRFRKNDLFANRYQVIVMSPAGPGIPIVEELTHPQKQPRRIGTLWSKPCPGQRLTGHVFDFQNIWQDITQWHRDGKEESKFP
jgi:hypothetical protein